MFKSIKLFSIMCLSMVLMSCATTPAPVVVNNNKTIPLLSAPPTINLSHIDMVNIQYNDKQYIALDVDNFKKLSTNVNKIIKYSVDQQEIIIQYEKIIVDHNNEVLNEK